MKEVQTEQRILLSVISFFFVEKIKISLCQFFCGKKVILDTVFRDAFFEKKSFIKLARQSEHPN